MRIWVATFLTESGDRGILGGWTKEPTDEMLDEAIKAYCDKTDDEPDLTYVELVEPIDINVSNCH